MISKTHFHSDLLWPCELPCPPLYPTHHARRPSRLLSNHPLNMTLGHRKMKTLLIVVAASCPRSAWDTQKPQNHRFHLNRVVGAAAQSPEGLGIPFLPSLPVPSLLTGYAEVGEAGSGSVPFWPHFSGLQGLGWWEHNLEQFMSSPWEAEFKRKF